MIAFGIAALVVTIGCVAAAERMAANRARSQRGWMIAAVLLGPLPLPVLFVLPRRKPAAG